MDKLGAECRDGSRLREIMDGLSFFDGYAGPELHTLSSYFRSFRADAGTEIFGEGEPGEFLCILVDGAAEVVKEDQHGAVRVVATVGPGKTLGEMALIDGEPRSASARLTQSAEVLVVTRESFERMGVEHPRLALQFTFTVARLLSRRLRLASGMLVDHLG